MINWQFFSLRFQEQDAFFPKSSSRGLLVPQHYGHVICYETKKIKPEGNWLIGGEFTLFA